MSLAPAYRQLIRRTGQLAAFGFLTLVASVVMAAPSHAATSVVSGTVTDASSTAVSGATVSFTKNIVSPPAPTTTTTAVNGTYSVTLDNAQSYTVQFAPAGGSGLVNLDYSSYYVGGSNQTFNAKLQTSTHTVTGIVSDAFGTVIPSATVTVVDAVGDLNTTTTDAFGSYSITEPAASAYMLRVYGARGITGAVLPKTFTWQQPLNLTADVTANIAPAAATVTVAILDSNGLVPIVPISTTFAASNGTDATFTAPNGFTTRYGSWGNETANSDGSGQVAFIGFQTSHYNVATNGDTYSGYSSTSFAGSPYYALSTSNLTKNITIPSNRKTVSGTFKVRRNGVDYPVPGANIQLTNSVYTNWYATTDMFGNYSFTNAGTTGYRLYFSYTGGSTDLYFPGTLNTNFTLDLTANRTGNNVVIPIKTLAVFTYDTERRPLASTASINVGASGTLASPFTGAGTMPTSFGNVFSSTGAGGYFHERWAAANFDSTVGVTATGSAYGNPTTVTASSSYDGVTTYTPFGAYIPSISSGSGGGGTPPAITWNISVNQPQYNIYRNGTLIGNATVKNYTDSSVSTSGNYYYQVTSVDSTGVESTKSSPKRITY